MGWSFSGPVPADSVLISLGQGRGTSEIERVVVLVNENSHDAKMPALHNEMTTINSSDAATCTALSTN